MQLFKLLMSLFLLGSAAEGALAQSSGEPEQVTDLHSQIAEVEAFLDGAIAAGMAEYHLPGATVSIVQGNRVVLAKGWGYSNVVSKQPVDPQTTLFRIGSISKTMTFTGAMQLVEQEQLLLDASLAKYINDVPIEPSYGELSMRHLMTHTPGYEDIYLGHFVARDIGQDYAPAEYLSQHAPKRVRPAGLMTSYSNYGVALAGHAIASISGQPFEEYADEHVFAPLGMTNTTFREHFDSRASYHMTDEMAAQRAIPYEWSRGAFRVVDDYHMHRGMNPAGSVSSTAADMALWMRAHLNGGRLDDDAVVLQPETHALMHEVAFSNAAGMAGNAHGFWANQISGYQTREHGGALFGFYSNMVLLPELDLGIFISTNGTNGRTLVNSVPRQLVNAFFPTRQELPLLPPDGFTESAETYTGRYQFNRRGFSGMDKLLALGGSSIVVSSDEKGYLYTTAGGETRQWITLGNHLFADTQTGQIMAFRLDENNVAQHVFGDYGNSSADRINYWRSDDFALLCIGLTAVIALFVLLAAWFRRHERTGQKPAAILAKRMVTITAVFWLAFLGGMALWVSTLSGAVPAVLFEFPDQPFVVLQWTGALIMLLTIACILTLPSAWMERKWPVMRRLRHTLVVFSFLLLTVVLWDWRLLGFQY